LTKGVKAGASANADVASADQTITIGPMTLEVKGAVGLGAEANFSLSATGISMGAGITPILGGSIKLTLGFGGAKMSQSGTVSVTDTGATVKVSPSKVE
jgi:hypothetical protein